MFGSVTVTYPNGWGIGLASSGSAAVLTDGKARFEIRAPNPKANSAKAIADSALVLPTKGGKVTSQGAVKIGEFDAYQYTTGAMRIIGVDASTRVVVVESVRLAAVVLFPGQVQFRLDAGYGQVLLAGALVGLGTQLGSGCTSGHGVCGVSRLSMRSIAATLLFMAAGMVTVYFWVHQS